MSAFGGKADITRTSELSRGMSALCHKRTPALQQLTVISRAGPSQRSRHVGVRFSCLTMSAAPTPLRDFTGSRRDVSDVPKSLLHRSRGPAPVVMIYSMTWFRGVEPGSRPAGLPRPNQALFNLALALTRSAVSKPSVKDL